MLVGVDCERSGLVSEKSSLRSLHRDREATGETDIARDIFDRAEFEQLNSNSPGSG
jgi:hypothetical protein